MAILEPLGVGVQRLADELLGHVGPVGVGGVEEVDAQLDGPSQHGNGPVVIIGGPPHAGAGQLHGAESEPVNRE